MTQNFTLKEFTKTNYKVKNEPNEKQKAALKVLCVNVLQPARNYIGAITVTSGFRGKELNEKVKGAKNSQHTKGEAADIVSKDNARLFSYIRVRQNFDQLIWEFGDDEQPAWIHVSAKESGNRKQVLRAVKDGKKTKYIEI